MKPNLSLVAVMLALWSMSTASGGVAQEINPVKSTKNRAIAATPRVLEEHAGALRMSVTPDQLEVRAARIREQLAKLTKNRALAASPRFLEDHPELLRSYPSAEEIKARAERRWKHLAELTKNRALAATPRFLEEHPWLARGGSIIIMNKAP